MYYHNKLTFSLIILCLSSLTMCTKVSSIDVNTFLKHIEKLDEPTYQYAYPKGQFEYAIIDSYLETSQSKKETKQEVIDGKYKIVNRYETKECDDALPKYNSFLLNVRSVFSSEAKFDVLEGTGDLKNFFVNKNRLLSIDPLSIRYEYNGYSDGVIHLHNGNNSEPGHYNISGAYSFDEYGYPINISISFNYFNYSFKTSDSNNRRIRYCKTINYKLNIDIGWRSE